MFRRGNFSDFESSISPLDVILFSGKDPVSKFIRYLEHKRLGVGEISHIGIVITSDLLPSLKLEPGKVYVWESTSSLNFPGLSKEAPDVIRKKGVFGVQLRLLSDLVKSYEGKIAWGRLINNPWNQVKRKQDIIDVVESLFVKYSMRTYDYNFINLLSALYPKLRPLRKIISAIYYLRPKALSNQLDPYFAGIFCSELVAIVYKKLGIIPKKIDPATFVPVDVFGIDEDGTGAIIEEEIVIFKGGDESLPTSVNPSPRIGLEPTKSITIINDLPPLSQDSSSEEERMPIDIKI